MTTIELFDNYILPNINSKGELECNGSIYFFTRLEQNISYRYKTKRGIVERCKKRKRILMYKDEYKFVFSFTYSTKLLNLVKDYPLLEEMLNSLGRNKKIEEFLN